MKKQLKTILTGCAVVLALTTTSVTALAATYQTPAEAAAGVTGKTLDEVVAARQAGKSYGTIASEAGKLTEYQEAMLEIHKESLEAQVANGFLTQEQADASLAAVQEQQTVCNGTGIGNGVCNGTGIGNGLGLGAGRGAGYGGGAGRGAGRGMGARLRDGSCLTR